MNAQKWLNRFQEAHGHRPRALITGGSSGMGLEYARQLVEIGCNLLLVSNQKEELKKTAETLCQGRDNQVAAHYQDLSTETAADELFAYCQAENLQVDILINNAGMFFFEELSLENERKAMVMMRLHIHTPTRLCLLFGEEMKRLGYGYLINTSSIAAKLPCPGITVYSASKVALFRDAALRRGRDHGLSRCHSHIAIQIKAQVFEIWRENWSNRYAAMAGEKGFEWHDAQETGCETRIHEPLFAAFDCPIAT